MRCHVGSVSSLNSLGHFTIKEIVMREKMESVLGWMKLSCDLGISLLCLAIIAGLLFGTGAPFFPVDVTGNVVALTKQLGSEGLVGLVAVWVLASIFNRQLAE